MNFGEGMEGAKKKPMARPYGVSLLFAGVDVNGPRLYHTDPSGTFQRCKAKAIGGGGDTAMGVLKDKYKMDMSLEEAEKLSVEILKQVMETSSMTPDHIEVMVIPTSTGKLKYRSRDEIQGLLGAIGA